MNLEDFLHHYEKNLTTPLDTEKPHPKTPQLSHLAQQDLGNALKILHKIDYESIENIQDNISSIEDLSAAIQACFAQGGKVILAGCGSSGRLAAIMESLYHKHAYKDTNAPIYTLIAGGSSALIHPQESAEDQLHGALETLKKQYQKQDLVIGLSASGNAPFILGLLEYVQAQNPAHSPWLLCNNPAQALLKRTPNHLCQNPNIRAMHLHTGPMALSGSTRMGATNALWLVLMLAFEHVLHHRSIKTLYSAVLDTTLSLNYGLLEAFITQEAASFSKKQTMGYQCPKSLALILLADLSERGPTFGITPFKHTQHGFYPYALNWQQQGSPDPWATIIPPSLMPFSPPQSIRLDEACSLTLAIREDKHQLCFENPGQYAKWTPIAHQGTRLLALKMLLNSHSTLVFGRLGFFEGNTMTHLKPSCYKLVDRLIQQVRLRLLHQVSYQDIARAFFDQKKQSFESLMAYFS